MSNAVTTFHLAAHIATSCKNICVCVVRCNIAACFPAQLRAGPAMLVNVPLAYSLLRLGIPHILEPQLQVAPNALIEHSATFTNAHSSLHKYRKQVPRKFGLLQQSSSWQARSLRCTLGYCVPQLQAQHVCPNIRSSQGFGTGGKEATQLNEWNASCRMHCPRL